MQWGVGEWAVLVLSGVLLVGYGLGYVRNRQRARELSAWIQEGVRSWGTPKSGGGLPGLVSGGRVRVTPASPPFREIEVVYVLSPRENLPFLLIHRLRGKKDEVTIRVRARKRPLAEARIIPAPRVPEPTAYEQGRAFEHVFSFEGYAVYCRGAIKCPQEVLRRLIQLLLPGLHRIVIRTESPHVLVRVDADALVGREPDEVFDALADVMRAFTAGSGE